MIAAWFARDTAALEIAREIEIPTPAHARAIFETLHRNIYAAFRADTEERIYDLLAAAVDRSLLDDLYADVHESLVLRDEGGAVARVQDVENLDGAVEVPPRGEGAPLFFVDWHWRVQCAITHYGHTHTRMNEYRARHTVRHDGSGWKIAVIDVKEQTRADKSNLPEGPK